MAGTLGATETDSTLDNKNLFAGPVMPPSPGTMTSGQNLTRGAVLEKSGNKYTVISTAANACAILAEDCDASSADLDCLVHELGHFHYDDLEWPSYSAANKKTALEALSGRGITVDKDVTDVEATA